MPNTHPATTLPGRRSGAARHPKPELSPSSRRTPHGRRLNPSQERKIVIAAQQGGQRERERLVDVFMPSIASMARMYRRSDSVEFNELSQDGVVGLLRALERFDPELGVPFWVYASWWVRQAMQHLVSERSRPTVMSDRALRQLARVKAAQRNYEQRCHLEPSCSELASETGLPRAHVESLLAIDRRARGLDEPARGQGLDGVSVGEQLADPSAEEPYESAANRVLAGQLPRLLASLTDRQHGVICARYGIGRAPQTLRQVAVRLGISAERVRQIEQAALERLNAAAFAS
jgi:RNA polymerase sigma factor (sigma-70 family)